MKKISIILVVLMLAVSIAGCTNDKESRNGSLSSDSNISKSTSQTQDKSDKTSNEGNLEEAGAELDEATKATEDSDGAVK